MELKSFREILLKKADGNPYLQTLIKYAKDDLIAEEVVEALLKMAEPSAAMGRGANHAVTSYAAGMKPLHVEQLRDALGHHISHYKGALKAHQAATDPAEKQKMRGVADKHLNRIIPLMHLAGRAAKHSNGAMTIDYPSTTPWETNYTTPERLPNGKLKEGTKDLGRRTSPNAKRDKNPRAVPDYRYLEMAPHPHHGLMPDEIKAGKTFDSPHKGGYPFEEIQLGSPMKRDAGQAYLPIEDVEVKDYVPHPFDAHPVHRHADASHHELGPEHHEAINSGIASWPDSEHQKQWLADQKAKHAKDPEAYKARGIKKPGHVFEGIDLQKMPHHSIVPQAAEAAAPEVPKPEVKASEPKAAPKTKKQLKEEKDKAAWDSLSDEQKKNFAHMFPQFANKK
jgi:hypothetical protein